MGNSHETLLQNFKMALCLQKNDPLTLEDPHHLSKLAQQILEIDERELTGQIRDIRACLDQVQTHDLSNGGSVFLL